MAYRPSLRLLSLFHSPFFTAVHAVLKVYLVCRYQFEQSFFPLSSFMALAYTGGLILARSTLLNEPPCWIYLKSSWQYTNSVISQELLKFQVCNHGHNLDTLKIKYAVCQHIWKLLSNLKITMYVAIILLNISIWALTGLNTLQQHQQRKPQALCNVAQNVDESPQCYHPPSKPETPSPWPGYIKRTRADCCSANWAAHNSELLSLLRRRPKGDFPIDKMKMIQSVAQYPASAL